MPGGWKLSMMWMPMSGQTELSAALMFLLMWECMMVAMMLLSALPILMIAQQAARHSGKSEGLVLLAALGYFASWLIFGAAVYLVGRTFAVLTMKSQQLAMVVPTLTGLSVMAAGIYQLTPWKEACLRHCRGPLLFVAEHWQPTVRGAFHTGFHHGNYCVVCCSALMVIQSVLGVMSFPLMIAVATVIAAEKLVPRGNWIAIGVGILSILAGAAMTFWRL